MKLLLQQLPVLVKNERYDPNESDVPQMLLEVESRKLDSKLKSKEIDDSDII